jgi:hypothetical protein
MRLPLAIVLMTLGAATATVTRAEETIGGAPEALAAVDRLLERLGGRAVWTRARSLHVRERAWHPRYGGPIQADFWRDLDRPAYHSRLTGPGIERVTVWDARSGWHLRDGQLTPMSGPELAAEIDGWKQTPYRIYRQLALRDSELLVELEADRLVVLDRQGRTLCWFVLDASGAPLKWGNVFRGEMNEHTYGPLVPFGSFRMPAWGTSADASWRFEYVAIDGSEEPLQLPTAPTGIRGSYFRPKRSPKKSPGFQEGRRSSWAIR